MSIVTLHLGVIDQPYAENPAGAAPAPRATRKGRVHRRTARAAARAYQTGTLARKLETTGDVAERLEARYHVMETFYNLHANEILSDFQDAIAGALENLDAGSPLRNDPFGSATSKVEERFKRFLMNKEMDGHIEGVPTMASILGVNHRLKHPYAKSNPSRPSFIDTGLYEASFKAWID